MKTGGVNSVDDLCMATRKRGETGGEGPREFRIPDLATRTQEKKKTSSQGREAELESSRVRG